MPAGSVGGGGGKPPNSLKTVSLNLNVINTDIQYISFAITLGMT